MILAIALAYLIGSIPTAYLIGKWVRQIDIREHGSGNVGATNVFRVMGKKWGTIALALDIGKGFAVTYLLANYFEECCSSIPFRLLLGLFTIAGHTWPVWLRFKGGKGVATSCGAFLGIFPKAILCALLVWIVCAFITRYVSVSSIAAAGSFILWLYVFYSNLPSAIFNLSLLISVSLFLFIVFTHRKNISRLQAGEEPKIGKSS